MGTGSARAGVFDREGRLLGEASAEVQMRTPRPEHFEQSSEDIWQACCAAVRGAIASSGVALDAVAGLAFDATCSLVVLGDEDRPLAVGADLPDEPGGQSQGDGRVFNVVVWCDHRATAEAEAINASRHRLLRHVGGAVSPEMEMPKLAWLKRHRPRTYGAARRFFDLADYLTYRAAGGVACGELRSACTTVCKWNFDATARDWAADFLTVCDLADLGTDRIGGADSVRDVGTSVPGGVGTRAAIALGLLGGTPLGVGIIDAHAGGVGCLGADLPDCADVPLAARLALIAGTSSCHMASSAVPVFVPGVWGPYDSAMVPGLFLSEGGQSASGAALDHLVETHAAYPALRREAEARSLRPSEVLDARVEALAAERGLTHHALLSVGIFVGPDFSGNRSPLADPHLRGSVIGLGPVGRPEEATSIEALAVLYLAAVQALAYSTRSIVEAINDARREAADAVEPIRAIVACGGLAKRGLYIGEHADALGMPIFLPREPGATMPLGCAMLAATAAGAFASVPDAMRGMGKVETAVHPCSDPLLRRFHDARCSESEHHTPRGEPCFNAFATIVVPYGVVRVLSLPRGSQSAASSKCKMRLVKLLKVAVGSVPEVMDSASAEWLYTKVQDLPADAVASAGLAFVNKWDAPRETP